MRQKLQGGRRSQLSSSNGSYCGGEGGAIALFPGAVAGELLICQAPASRGKGSCQFVFLALFHFLCLYLNFLLEVRCSTFGISVLPASLRTHVHLPPLLAKWYVSILRKEQHQQKGLLEPPPRNTTQLCQSHARDWQVITISSRYGNWTWVQFSLEECPGCWLKGEQHHHPLFRLSGKSSFPAPKCNFTEIIQWTGISSWN